MIGALVRRLVGGKVNKESMDAAGKVIVESGRTWWPLAAVAIVVVVMTPVGFVIYKMTNAAEKVVSLPERMGSALVEAVRPKVDVKNVVLSTVSSMQRKAKLVVLDTTIDLDITKDESYKAAGFFYLGTNRVRLIAKENRLQYVIGLEGTREENFAYDEEGKRLTIFVNRPTLDEEMVSVQSDPAKCYAAEYSGGWMRFDLRETLKHAQEMLRPALLEQGKSTFVVDEANRAGIAAVKTFVDPMVAVLKGEGIAVEVAYR